MNDYLTKPIELRALADAIERNLTALPPVSETSPYDRQTLLERVGGDEDMLRELVGIFLDESPKTMTQLHRGVSNGDPKAIGDAAHALKGSLLILSADDAAQAALAVEKLARSGDLSGLQQAMAQLAIEYQRLTTAMKSNEVPVCES
jgi:two-component system sensor histidine kinase/response regulator